MNICLVLHSILLPASDYLGPDSDVKREESLLKLPRLSKVA